jgi:hypothetical protein
MTRFHLLFVPAALALCASPVLAQHWGAAPASNTAKPAAEVHQASGGSWSGTASKWGGSPVQSQSDHRARNVNLIQGIAYYPAAVAAQVPVQAACADAVDAAATSSSVEMKVITSKHDEPRQLTTIEVYRLQPRFQKP